MKKSPPKTEKRKKTLLKKPKDSAPLYESKMLTWENLLEVDESEIDFPGEDFGLDFPVSILENHKRQSHRSPKQSKEETGEKEK
jgi:hypothetical protein